jgi:UDP-N-acetylglucosamine transferase subunit ALG13
MSAVRPTEEGPLPVVLVTVGTTWHNFARLMGWLESWLLARPGRVRLIVQHGPNPCPAGAEGFAMCSTAELVELISRSDVIVTQGGPGGIMDSRNCGILPIAVPRRPEFAEVVDDHQVRFCRHLARSGMIRLAETEQELHLALDVALADPAALRIESNGDHVVAAVARTGELIDDLVARRPARHRRRARQA